MAIIFGIKSNVSPTGYTGTVVNRFTSTYTYEKTEKEYLGNPPVVVDTRMTAEKKTRGFDGIVGFTAKPDEDAVLALLGTQVTITVVSDDTAGETETITGTLMKAVHSGEKDGWWEAALTVGPDTILPV